MNSDSTCSKEQHKYNVVSVEKISTPEGMPKGDWHRYIIARGNSKIEGIQAGTLSNVKKYAEDFVEGLNERAIRGQSAYSARKKK